MFWRKQTRMEPLLLIFATSLVKSLRLRLPLFVPFLQWIHCFQEKGKEEKEKGSTGSQSRLQCQFPPIWTMQYQACMSTSEVSRTQSHNFAVSTTSQGTVTIHHLKSRFAKNDFRVYVSKPGCRANLRSACQFQWNYEEVYATDIYLLESLTTAENLQFGERWIIVVPCQRRH